MLERLNELARRLDELSARLESVERALGRGAEATAKWPLAGSPPAAASATEDGPSRWAAVLARARAVVPPPLPRLDGERRVPPPVADGPVAPPVAAQSQPPAFEDFTADEPEPPSRTWESTLGIKWAAVGGAVFILIAIGLFLKLGIDNGWLGRIPFGARCLLAALLGLVFVGVGEVARRKINAWAAVGLFGAGVAAVFASAFAAGAFEVVSREVGFGLLVASAGMGVTIGARTKLASVAILAIVLGYVAPFLVGSRNDSEIVLPAYLLTLLATGLALAAWRRGNFRWVGRVSWWGSLGIGALWILDSGHRSPAIATVFLATAWLFVHLSHYIAARGQERMEGITDEDDAELERSISREAAATPAGALRAVPTLSSFSSTSWTFGFMAYVFAESAVFPAWLAPAAGVGVTLLCAWVLVGGLDLLTQRPRTDRELLGAGLMVQAGSLLVAAIALGVSGQAQTVVGLGVSVAAVVAGRWVGSWGLRLYGLVVLALATGRLVSIDAMTKGPARGPVSMETVALIPLSAWMLMAVLGAFAWLATGALWRGRADAQGQPRPSVVPLVACIVGIALLLLSVVSADAHLGAIAGTWAAIGLVAAVAARWWDAPWMRPMRVGVVGSTAAMLAVIPFMTVAFGQWPPSGSLNAMTRAGFGSLPVWLGSTVTPGLHAAFIIGLGVGLAQVVAGRLVSPGRGARSARVATGCVGGAFLLLVSSVEAGRAGLVLGGNDRWGWSGVALWWGACAVAGVLVRRGSAHPARLVAACALGSVAPLAWGVAYLTPRLGVWFGFDAGFVHPGMVTALLLVGGLAVVAIAGLRGLRSLEQVLQDGSIDWAPARRAAGWVCVWMAGGLLFAATSLEAIRGARALVEDQTAEAGALSTWWAIFATALVVVGFAYRAPWSRYVGLGLLSLTALKILVLDMANVQPLWRILSVAITGVLMLGVAVLYSKLTAAESRNPRDE
ncbi:MAG: DUF2339 domain-containing protein [Phycisphaerales bacterium]